ncbi:FLYWCH zinc finger domain-containing protein [Phthorimaea operculella]|nr:FLYWCH zinc finger domain-containing protein [Phthorimaea operculella]
MAKFIAEFVTTKGGNKLLIFNNYAYGRQYTVKNGNVRYRCTGKHYDKPDKRCRSFLVVDNAGTIRKNFWAHEHPPSYKYKKGSKYFMLDGFTYGRHFEVVNGVRWRCTGTDRLRKQRCKAFVVFNQKDELIKKQGEHEHPVPGYWTFIITEKGNSLFTFNNFVYGKQSVYKDGKERWRCTSSACGNGKRRCTSYVILDEDGSGNIHRNIWRHNHGPPKYRNRVFRYAVG